MATLASEHVEALRTRLPQGELTTAERDVAAHSRDESTHAAHPPDVVVYAERVEDVQATLAYCHAEGVPVTPWGAGTSLEANPLALHGGLVLDCSRMDAVLETRPGDLQVTVEPGVLHTDLNEHLSRHGLFFPPDPGAPCTIAGMIANNAAGIRGFKYGATRDYVLELDLVLADGSRIHCGTRAMRHASGYDLVRLFVGSEGTLGVVTRATLRLAGRPPELSAATAAFPSLEGACQAVVEMVQAGLAPDALELLDAEAVREVNAFFALALPEAPVLFLEFSGTEASVAGDVQLAQAICEDHGCTRYERALGRAERDRLWRARHEAYYAATAAHPGQRSIITDVAVPISALPELVAFAREQADAEGLSGPIHAHAGDGNFHLILFFEDAHEARAHRVNEALVERALEVGGTATGEHGVGAGKIRFMSAEHGASYAWMRKVKDLFDPKGILNPGKMFR